MRKIIFAILGMSLTVSSVMGQIGKCEKNCGIDYGKCLIQKLDFVGCLQEEAACSLECLKGLTVSSELKNLDNYEVDASTTEICAEDCAVDFGKCLIQTFDIETCLKGTKTCTLDCFKGIDFIAKWDEPVVPYVKAKSTATCQKNCAIDLGKCVITTGDFVQCMKAEAACSLDCLKGATLATEELEV